MGMILKKLWISIMMVLLLEGKWWCNGCLEDDRIALLNLKAYFNHPNGKAVGSWQNDNSNFVNGAMLYVIPLPAEIKGTINIQNLCKGLTSLEELYLDGNEIEGFEFSHGLPNLQYLDLSYNRINNLLSSPKGFPSLKYLDLSYNSLKGIFHMKELDDLRNLEELDLSGNQVIKFEAKEESHNMNILEELRLDFSSLREISIQSLGALPSLKFLSLCSLENTLPAQGLPNFKNLEILHMNSSFSGNDILQVIAKMTSLKALSLQNCGLNGIIPLASVIAFPIHLAMSASWNIYDWMEINSQEISLTAYPIVPSWNC
ncbi:hypothetical protein JCGZ_20116 [Jatropha curcas]|uniref:Leucine-rich repeat-containing N-terminal plant-type domain-containing protein n=1 Tax=Jatropha curcas TaxID=180498 RepID=A0A067K6W4_JATCU|nr:hypothetical protein JCGZ_20116 [Jatropha curcas]